MVTVQGGYAKRGNLTAAFSDQLRTSYRQTDVMVMFTRASYSLTDEAGWNTILTSFPNVEALFETIHPITLALPLQKRSTLHHKTSSSNTQAFESWLFMGILLSMFNNQLFRETISSIEG